MGPLVWLLAIFSRERQERYAAALELHRAYRGTVMLLSDVVEFDDPYTAAHSRSIVDLVHAVADELGIRQERRQEIEFAALLHDVGKIAIPKEILNKPAALTDAEFEVMKTHTIEGQFMLDRVGGLLGRVGEVVRSCHERWDGTGYPDGLRGEEIPFESRLVFACDAYNAMTTDRVYRDALSRDEAIVELLAGAGTQFDPGVVDTLISVVHDLEGGITPADEVRAVLASAPVPAPSAPSRADPRRAASRSATTAASHTAAPRATCEKQHRPDAGEIHQAARRQERGGERPRGERVLDSEDTAEQRLRRRGLDDQPLVDQHHPVRHPGGRERGGGRHDDLRQARPTRLNAMSSSPIR